MTIVAAYRLDDRTIYVNDFRVTIKNPNRQMDVSFKFKEFDKRIGLFLAGDVNTWKALLPTITDLIPNVNLGNVLNEEGPLVVGLQRAVERLPNHSYRAASAIGFLIDDEFKRNVQFVIRLQPGAGLLLNELATNSCLVIGSGADIPNIEKKLEEQFLSDYQEVGDDLYELGCRMRRRILKEMSLCGSSSFSKLGISPCMSVSTLVASHFMVRGEEHIGETYSETYSHRYYFTIEKNEEGEIFLHDKLNGIVQKVNDICSMSQDVVGDVFDPENLTKDEDPTVLFPEATQAYLFHQWVVQEKEFLWRDVFRVPFIEVSGKTLCSPERYKIASFINDKMPTQDLFGYTNLDKLYFIVEEEDREEFEAGIQENLTNHQWLSKFIKGYEKLYQEKTGG